MNFLNILHYRNDLFLVMALGLIILMGCSNTAGNQLAAPISQTVSADQTLIAAAGTAGEPIRTFTPGNEVLATVQPMAQELSGNCNSMAAEIPLDITIPDQSLLEPGERFIKTWRVKNIGTCDWTSDYRLIWFSGEVMNPSMPWYLGRTVVPGEVVDIGIEMVAPGTLGVFRSYFKMMDTKGALFGLGPASQAPLWVSILVVDYTEPTRTPLPTITLRPTAAVYHSGTLDLLPMDQVDLDQGIINTGADDDLSLHLDENNQYQAIPLGGTKIGYYGVAPPTEAGCRLVDLQRLLLFSNRSRFTRIYSVCIYSR
jgi:hypothetical protein